MRPSKTFALLGISSALCFMAWRSARTTETKNRVSYQNPSRTASPDDTAPKDVRFEQKSALDGLTEQHFRFSSEVWESSDGVAIFLRREYCGSPKNAEKALSQSVEDSAVIFETRVLVNKNHETTGKRIVASFDKDPPPQRIILWTDGEMLYSVESSSFKHALLFEKMLPSL